MQFVCQQIPETFTSQHGYHRDCYQRFSSNLNRLTKPSGEKPSSVSSSVREPRRSSTEKDSVFFQPDCIFCNKSGRKSIKVRGSWTTESTTSFAFGGGGRILEVATDKNDTKLLRRITGFDLFACEARFHESCRTQYLQTPQKWRSQNPANVEQQTSLETAHKQAFDKVCIIIDRQVLIEQKVIKLSELLIIYITELERTPYSNKNYRGSKLKSKIQQCEHYKDTVGFCPIGQDGRFQSYLLYNRATDLASVVKATYELKCVDTIKEASRAIRNEILTTFQSADELNWPPTAQSLSSARVVPKTLGTFLKCVFGFHY